MINLCQVPNTNAEACALGRLTEVARIGALYYKIFDAQPSTGTEHIFDYLLNNLSLNDPYAEYEIRQAKIAFEAMREANKAAEELVGEQLMKAIDEFNAACDKIKNDPRPRSEILKAEAPKPQKKISRP